MPLYQPTVPFRYVQPLIAFVREQDRPAVDRILAAGSITRADLNRSWSVTMAQFDAMFRSASEVLARQDLGFELGREIGRNSHDALSAVLRTCPTLSSKLRMITRYWRMISPALVLRYERYAQHGEYVLRPGAAMSPATLYGFEEIFAVGFHHDCQALLGDTAGLEIWLSMPPPAHLRRYRRLAPTRFRFSATSLPEVRCFIPDALLDRRCADAMADDVTAMQGLLESPGTVARRRQVSDWIALMLREAEGVQPTLASLAQLLDVSARTLSRQLAAERCNLRELAGAVRHERACAMLRGSPQQVREIASRLGYTSTAAFSTAFRRMAGVSPMAYRQEGRDGTVRDPEGRQRTRAT